MVSFARARTKSLLSRLWLLGAKPINNDMPALDKSNELIDKQQEQNNCFLETTKNGGLWFS